MRNTTLLACLVCVLQLIASCDRISQISDDRNIQVANQLSSLQIAILSDAGISSEKARQSSEGTLSASNGGQHAGSADGHGHTGSQIRVAVISVADQFLFSEASADTEATDEETSQPQRDAALRRERQIRQSINARLVGNSLLAVIQPAASQLELARTELIANDSAALSQQTSIQLGEELHVQYIICALIDREGQDVDIVAQHTADGAIVFQQTRDWSGRLRVAEAPAETQ